MSPAGGEADADKRVELKSGYALPHDEDVGAVIVGFDRNINYYKIQYAQVASRPRLPSGLHTGLPCPPAMPMPMPMPLPMPMPMHVPMHI